MIGRTKLDRPCRVQNPTEASISAHKIFLIPGIRSGIQYGHAALLDHRRFLPSGSLYANARPARRRSRFWRRPCGILRSRGRLQWWAFLQRSFLRWFPVRQPFCSALDCSALELPQFLTWSNGFSRLQPRRESQPGHALLDSHLRFRKQLLRVRLPFGLWLGVSISLGRNRSLLVVGQRF